MEVNEMELNLFHHIKDLDDNAMGAIARLPADRHLRVELDVAFHGEVIRSNQAFARKIQPLFDINFIDIKAERKGRTLYYSVDLHPDTFPAFLDSPNLGIFCDYNITVIGYKVVLSNGSFPQEMSGPPDTPLKLAQRPETDPNTRNLTIMLRKGPNHYDQPAKGMLSFNLLSDRNEILKILTHFGVCGNVAMASKGSPADPSLELTLTEELKVLVDSDSINSEPLRVFKASEQSKAAFGSSDVYAHAQIDPENRPRRIVVEAVGGRMDLDTLKHKLSYHGEILGETKAETWAPDHEGPLGGVLTGAYSMMMKIRVDLNYVLHKNKAFRVIYPGQPTQCSMCYGWHHILECTRRDENRLDLTKEYYQKWMRQVGYSDLVDSVVKKVIPTPGSIMEAFQETYGDGDDDHDKTDKDDHDSVTEEPVGILDLLNTQENWELGTGSNMKPLVAPNAGSEVVPTLPDKGTPSKAPALSNPSEDTSIKGLNVDSKPMPTSPQTETTSKDLVTTKPPEDTTAKPTATDNKKSLGRSNGPVSTDPPKDTPIKGHNVDSKPMPSPQKETPSKALVSTNPPKETLTKGHNVDSKPRPSPKKDTPSKAPVPTDPPKDTPIKGHNVDSKPRPSPNKETTTKELVTTEPPEASNATTNAKPATMEKEQSDESDQSLEHEVNEPEPSEDVDAKNDDTVSKNKRKAATQSQKETKRTGSGRKKSQFTEKEKAQFSAELREIGKEASKKVLSTVRREKLKRNLDTMVGKYHKRLFDNPDGRDPAAEDTWNAMSAEANTIKAALARHHNN